MRKFDLDPNRPIPTPPGIPDPSSDEMGRFINTHSISNSISSFFSSIGKGIKKGLDPSTYSRVWRTQRWEAK